MQINVKMNLIVLYNEDIHDGVAEITGRRLEHILSFIKPSVGDTLKAGILNGLTGEGTVTEISCDRLALTLSLHDSLRLHRSLLSLSSQCPDRKS